METEIAVPKLPDSDSKAILAHLYVNEGQGVGHDQKLFDVETDKVVLEVVAPSAGIIEKIKVSEGEHVSSEQVVMNLRENTNSDIPADSKEVKYIETIVEKRVKDDSERIALEQVIGNSLFDKRGIVCGLLGLVVGLIIGAIGAVVVLG